MADTSKISYFPAKRLARRFDHKMIVRNLVGQGAFLRVLCLVFVAAMFIAIGTSASLGATCECSNMDAESEADGTCTKTETSSTCEMDWNSGSSSSAAAGVSSLRPGAFFSLQQQMMTVLPQNVQNFNIVTPDDSRPQFRVSPTLSRVPPQGYTPDTPALFQIFMSAGLTKAGVSQNDILAIANDIHGKRTQILRVPRKIPLDWPQRI